MASENQKQLLSMPSLLTGTTMISTCSTFQSCRLNISDDLQRQGKCSDSCTRLVNPYWYLQLLQMTNQDVLYFWLSKPPSSTCCAKKTVVNTSQSNYTTENYLHIASIIVILNNGHLILKIFHVLGYDVLDHVYFMY